MHDESRETPKMEARAHSREFLEKAARLAKRKGKGRKYNRRGRRSR